MKHLVWMLIGLLGFWAHGAQAQQMPVPGSFGQGGFGTARPNSTTGTSPSGIDDSTKVIYGPRTTRYTLEDDLLNDRPLNQHMPDTTMDEVHNFLYVQRSHNLYQDLGSLGTAMRPVFVEEPLQLGAQTGYTVFNAYTYQPQNVKYFNTKSPFSDMYLALGGRNQNILRFEFAQNIKPNWNVGAAVQRFTALKQYGLSGTKDPTKQLAENWSFVGHTNYVAKNNKYTLLLHFINLNHQVQEQGGVLPGKNLDSTDIIYNYTGPARLRTNLTYGSPQGTELRNNWHIYHQYKLGQGFQVFHRLDYQRQKNTYLDTALARNYAYYPAVLGDTSRIVQDARFRLLQNQFGLKGQFSRGGSSFNYRAWLRNRIYGQYTRYNTSAKTYNEYETRKLEMLVGGWLGYFLRDSVSRITAEAEYQVGGGYRLQGELNSPWLSAGYTSMLVQPTLLQERFQSHVLFWRNENFNLRAYNHAYGKLHVRYKNLRIEPGLDYFLLSNYVYFDTNAIARQFNGSFSVLRSGLGYRYQAGRFLASGQLYYTLQSRRDMLRTPPFFGNALFQYEILYAKALYIQVGVALHYKSAYYADAYMPVTQQFYIQNKQAVEGYLKADVYANFRVNRTRLFVELTHANQGIFQPGYFVAPTYLGMRRGFAFGVDWYLFD